MKYISNIIQGDKKTYKIGLLSGGTEISHSLVDNLYFTSKDLNINKTGVYDNVSHKYTFTLLPSETILFESGDYSFDITVDFLGDNYATPLYEGVLKVLPKYNKVGS